MNGDTVQKFIDRLNGYFSLCVLDNNFERVSFTVTILNDSAYTWYTIQHYAIGTEYANRLTWEHLKSDLHLYFKPCYYT